VEANQQALMGSALLLQKKKQCRKWCLTRVDVFDQMDDRTMHLWR